MSKMMSSNPKIGEKEFICGWGAAFINICVTFPLNKIMFRQMVHGVNPIGAVKQLQHEGLKNLYKGLLPPLMSKTASVSLMFGSYTTYKSWIDQSTTFGNQIGNPSNVISLPVAAMLAGSTEALLCPFERTQMLLQSKELSVTYSNTLSSFVKMRQFGLREYYRGLTAILIRNGPSNVIFFSCREYLQCHQKLSSKNNSWYLHLLNDFVTGAILGAVISTIFYPINVIRTKMQTIKPGSEFLSISTAARLVYIERGRSISKLFFGVSVNCTRALISWGIINASYEILRKLLYQSQVTNHHHKLSPSSSLSSSPSSSSLSLSSSSSLSPSPSLSSSSSSSLSCTSSLSPSQVVVPQSKLDTK